MSARKCILRANTASLNQSHCVDIMQQTAALCKKTSVLRKKSFHISLQTDYKTVLQWKCLLKEPGVLKWLRWHTHTCQLVHWVDIMKHRHVHSIISARVWKFGSRFTPPIRVKPYSAIIFVQWPASSCKTLADLKHKLKDA